MILKRLIPYGFLITVIGFSCGEIAKVKQENVEPVGIIQGIVRDDIGNPLNGVVASLLLNGVEIQSFNAQDVIGATDLSGIYYFYDIPLGSVYTLFFKANGYGTSKKAVNMNVNITDFPQGNVVVNEDVVMYKLDASLKGNFKWCPSSKTCTSWPDTYESAGNASVVIDFRDCNIEHVKEHVKEVKTQSDGSLGPNGITGLPGSYTGDFDGCSPKLLVLIVEGSTGIPHTKKLSPKLYHGAITFLNDAQYILLDKQ